MGKHSAKAFHVTHSEVEPKEVRRICLRGIFNFCPAKHPEPPYLPEKNSDTNYSIQNFVQVKLMQQCVSIQRRTSCVRTEKRQRTEKREVRESTTATVTAHSKTDQTKLGWK